MAQEFTNNASALLITDTQAGDVTIELAPGDGNNFPNPDAGDANSFAMVTLEDANGNFEITKMTERTGDILTIVRAQEDTSAQAFPTGSRCECRLTAGSLANFKQQGDNNTEGEGLVETDGFKIWHNTDPSTYQFFTMEYKTTDPGNPVLAIVGPPFPGTKFNATIIGTDGGKRSLSFGVGTTSQGAGVADLRLPANLQMEHRTRFREYQTMWMWWDTVSGENSEVMWEPNIQVQGARYRYTCKSGGIVNVVGFDYSGAMDCFGHIEIAHGYRQALVNRSFFINYQLNPEDNGTDRIYYSATNTVDSSSNDRKQEHVFQVREKVVGTGPATFPEHNITLTQQGTVELDEDRPITKDTELATKKYVDAVTGGYARVVLWNNDTGSSSGTHTLANGQQWSDVLSIEVTAFNSATNQYQSTTIDTETLLDKGYSARWLAMDTVLFLEPKTATTFDITNDGASDFKLTRIIGKFAAPA